MFIVVYSYCCHRKSEGSSPVPIEHKVKRANLVNVASIWGERDAYLKQLDTHDHAQLSIRYQGADQGFTRELHNLNLQ